MSLRAVRIQPAPPSVTRSKLRAELLAAGVPLPPSTPEHPLECSTSGDSFYVVVVADSPADDRWDAAVMQVVTAHVPDAEVTIKEFKKNLVANEFNRAEVINLALRGLVKMHHLAYQNQRNREITLLDRLTALGINHGIAPQPARTEASIRNELLQWIYQQINAE